MKKINFFTPLFICFFILVITPQSFAKKVAVIQYEIKDQDKIGKDANLIEKYIRVAARNGAQLIVSPETSFYRYEPWKQNGVTMLDLASQYNSLKNRFSALAKELKVSLVIGLREPSGDKEKPVFNTALYIGPDGWVKGKQHKLVPSNSEKSWTKPGAKHAIFETSLGRIGMMICKTAKTNWWNSYEKEDNLDLFILIAGDNDATSFEKFSTICTKSNCYGLLSNQITGTENEGRKGNSAWGYPDGRVDFLGEGEQIFYTDMPLPIKNELIPQKGQIIVDPNNPMWMVYNRDNNNDSLPDPYFMCGPGDPESFLYRGARNRNGTRNGDQLQLISKLKENGGNCIYLMVVRTHGGDASKDLKNDPGNYPDDMHNPWVGQNPDFGLNPDILDQWEIWFSEMDKSGIAIYLFIYDDAINVGGQLGWPLDASGNLHPGEKRFIQDLVNKFEHHRNLVWCVMEEGQEIGENWQQHVLKIAEVIKEADDYGHVVASHQLPGGVFYHADDPNIDQFAIQSASWEAGATSDSIHNWVVDLWNRADGRYSLNMSEDKIHYNLSQVSDTEAIRKRNWAIAMAGSYVMVFGMDIVNTPVGQLHDCRRLQDFFESTNFNTMAPNDKLKYMGTQYVLASSGESYIAYSSSQPNKMGLRDMVEGRYTFSWLDCVSGKTLKVKNVAVKSGNQSWNVPAGFQREVALYVTRVDEKDQYVLLSRPLNERNINKKIKEEKSDKLRNTIPKATDKSVSIVKNNSIDIQLSYLDLDGGPGPYTTVLLTPPVNGVLSGVGNDLTYTPVKEFVGIDRFTWKVNDGLDDSKPAVVTITINK